MRAMAWAHVSMSKWPGHSSLVLLARPLKGLAGGTNSSHREIEQERQNSISNTIDVLHSLSLPHVKSASESACSTSTSSVVLLILWDYPSTQDS